jgi:carboxypeptidase C (cathepsin A)
MWDSFEAIGPVQILGNTTDYVFHRNPYTWTNAAHILIVDQPAGTGFSVANDLNVTSTWQASQYFQVFLARFYQLFPELALRPLFIWGESYGGKYVPVFTYELLNNATFMSMINLAGAGVGNPWSDPIG